MDEAQALRSEGAWTRLLLRRGLLVVGALGVGLALSTAMASDAEASPLDETLDSLSATVDELLSPISDSVTAPVADAAVSPVVDEVVAPLVNEAVTPVAPVVDEIVRPLETVLEDVVAPVTEPVAEHLDPVLDDVLAPVIGVTTPVIDAVKPILEPVVESLSPVTDLVEGVAEPLEPVLDALDPAPSDMPPTTEPVEPTEPGGSPVVIPPTAPATEDDSSTVGVGPDAPSLTLPPTQGEIVLPSLDEGQRLPGNAAVAPSQPAGSAFGVGVGPAGRTPAATAGTPPLPSSAVPEDDPARVPMSPQEPVPAPSPGSSVRTASGHDVAVLGGAGDVLSAASWAAADRDARVAHPTMFYEVPLFPG